MTVPSLTVPVLIGAGVRLRPFVAADAEAVLEASTDPVIPLLTTVPSVPDPELAAAFIERQHHRAASGEGFSWAVECQTGRCVGQVGLWLRDRPEGRARLGYWTRPGARRQGHAAEALTVAVSWAWTLPDLHRLELHVEPDNLGSLRVAESVGFACEGLLRSWLPLGDQRRDVLVLSLVRP